MKSKANLSCANGFTCLPVTAWLAACLPSKFRLFVQKCEVYKGFSPSNQGDGSFVGE